MCRFYYVPFVCLYLHDGGCQWLYNVRRAFVKCVCCVTGKAFALKAMAAVCRNAVIRDWEDYLGLVVGCIASCYLIGTGLFDRSLVLLLCLLSVVHYRNLRFW
jgi:hypothetical protein